MIGQNLHIALLHYPVYNKQRKEIVSAVSPIDLHDISRAARTYNVGSFSLVTPLLDQQDLAQRVVKHWTEGFGATYNPTRKDALSLVRIKSNLNEVVEEIEKLGHGRPKITATDARPFPDPISYDKMARLIKEDKTPHLILFGTAWGLTVECIGQADYTLEPIASGGDYNHLSVRTAAAIILDRLLGTGNTKSCCTYSGG
ncbi:MAG: RNA methyltransferase [Pseudomonadota bacterium]